MSEIKQKALAKMNEEMSQKHSPAIDVIHNFLCDQNDDELFENICKDGKSIADAYAYCVNKASEQRDGNCAMISDSVVFCWVVDYFKSELKAVKSKAAANVSTSNESQHTNMKEISKIDVKSSQKKADFERINLFEL
jgi:lin1252 protein|nr:MAG TPA: PcfK-like protein [Caudoviricetes sp.]DAX89108.1 MAG TPA: PcfK-like protein [Caudoviricetes sp.]